MKKYVMGLAGLLMLLQPIGAHAVCEIPAGTYKYLYSDGFETYYYNDKTTIRVDAAGTRIVQHGDFDILVQGKRYQRAGDRFTFTNENGRYTSMGNGPISFYPSSPSTIKTAAVLPAGTSYTDFFGTYTKQSSGNIYFKPRLSYNALVITDEKCSTAAAPAGTTVVTTPTTTIVSTPGTMVNYDYDTVIVEMGAKKQDGVLSVDLDTDILFDYDKSDITSKAQESLAKLAYLIRHDRQGLVVIRGHTDSKGTENYNQNLSMRRAQSVAGWLEAREGIDRANFMVQGFGEMYPKAPNTYSNGSDNPEGRAKNRRVEVLIQTVAGAKVPPPTAGLVVVNPSGIAVKGADAQLRAAEARARALDARASAAEARARAAAAGGTGSVSIGQGGILIQGSGDDETGSGTGTVSIGEGGILVRGYGDDDEGNGDGTVSIGPNGIVVHGEGY